MPFSIHDGPGTPKLGDWCARISCSPLLRGASTYLRVHFQRPDVSLVLDTDFPDLRFDRILLDAMSLQI